MTEGEGEPSYGHHHRMPSVPGLSELPLDPKQGQEAAVIRKPKMTTGGRGWRVGLHGRTRSDTLHRGGPTKVHEPSAGAQLHEGSIGLTKFFTARLLGTLNMLLCIVKSIKRGCLVQRFPNLFDHRNLSFFFPAGRLVHCTA